jgi:hypothetical protein
MGTIGMRHFVIAGLVLASLVAGGLVLGRTGPVDDEQAARQADRALVTGLGRGDGKAIRAMLDRHFTWIDGEGRMHGRRDTLKQIATLAAVNMGDSDVRSHYYGRMLTVRSSHGNARFLRVFVRRHHGWKAIALMETELASPAAPAAAQLAAADPPAAGDCANPCRTVPYVPKTQMDKDILAAWQKTKTLEWKPDAALWGSFMADEFQTIDNTAVRGKDERLAVAKQAQDAGLGVPGDPVTSMRIFDFGTKCALMISQHTPYRGGKPYASMRVWVNRDNRWQLAVSQLSAIQSAPPAPAIASTQ